MCKTTTTTTKLKSSSSSSPSPSSSSSSSDSLQLLSLKNSLPKDVFIKSLFLSFFYLFIDIFMWFGSLYLALIITKSSYWNTLEYYQQALFSFCYWNFSGFFMWSLFVVGHDCGHGTFSDYEWLNDLVGNIVHGSLLVPYWPWQMTHRRHHMYHNHAEKDYSHPWYTPERLARPECGTARFVHKYNFIMGVFPYIGWPLYLLGAPDGNHFIPIPSDRMWKESSVMEYIQCIVSTIIVITWGTFVFYLCNWNLTSFVYYYFIPILVFGWWLVTVTYLQHHSPSTLIYDDKHWKFLNAAFETVDRKYGFGIDFWSHHITDCHVIHHLFFTKIPHYNLYRATEAMKEYLKENNLLHYYRQEDTSDFFYRIHYYLISHGLRAVMYDPVKHSPSTTTTTTSSSTTTTSPASISSVLSSKDLNEENKKKI